MSQLLRLSSFTLRRNCNKFLTHEFNGKILREDYLFGCRKCLHRKWSGEIFLSRGHSHRAAEEHIPYIFGRKKSFKWKWKRKKKEMKKKEEMLLELAEALETRAAQLEASEGQTLQTSKSSLSVASNVQGSTHEYFRNDANSIDGQNEMNSLPIELTNQNPVKIDSTVIKSLKSVFTNSKTKTNCALMDNGDLLYRNILQIDMGKFGFPLEKNNETSVDQKREDVGREELLNVEQDHFDSFSVKPVIIQQNTSPDTSSTNNNPFSTIAGTSNQETRNNVSEQNSKFMETDDKPMQQFKDLYKNNNHDDMKSKEVNNASSNSEMSDLLQESTHPETDELTECDIKDIGWIDFAEGISHRVKSKKTSGLVKEYSEKQIELLRQSFNQDFKSYIDVCVFSGQIHRAHSQLRLHHVYNTEEGVMARIRKITDVEIFNNLIHAWAKQGNVAMIGDVMKYMEAEDISPNMQTFAASFECLGRKDKFYKEAAESIVMTMEREGLDVRNVLNESLLMGDEIECVQRALNELDIVPNPPPPVLEPYENILVDDLEKSEEHSEISRKNPFFYESPKSFDLTRAIQAQFKLEEGFKVNVSSIVDDEAKSLEMKRMTQDLEWNWSKNLHKVFIDKLRHLQTKSKTPYGMTILPYLRLFSEAQYVNLMLKELTVLKRGSEFHSPSTYQLKMRLGESVYKHYLVQVKNEEKTRDKKSKVYSQYAEACLKEDFPYANHRECWRTICMKVTGRPQLDEREKVWSGHVLRMIGSILFQTIMEGAKINVNMFKEDQDIVLVPAFYTVFRSLGTKISEELKPHPVLVQLVEGAREKNLTFDATELPMLVPPIPWTSPKSGGHLHISPNLLRLQPFNDDMNLNNQLLSKEKILPVLDSLNMLSNCPWIINNKMLDIIMEVFTQNGNKDLDIPPPASTLPPIQKVDRKMPKEERSELERQRFDFQKLKNEMHSLWCSELYRLSIANSLRGLVFWLPHSLDFRGRTYPCPPHLNHLGGDAVRSFLLYAKGKPLGPKGLDWIKIHLINLTGFKKRSSNKERLEFANQMMGEIFDSVDKPMTGRKWWQTSDEPWQTLACCLEIVNAVRSGDPENYVSHFPVHQDGSCNGLQHYAALGRDQAGAESVNLCPFDAPKDVYSDVVELVEEVRAKDAEDGVEIAQVLDGFVQRKVIKQTIMTTVYGVTLYGSKAQILRQLQDISDFPQERAWEGSIYLANQTFFCLQKMFTSAKEIQDWLTVISCMISRECKIPLQWTTPLGLPVIQPYYKYMKPSNTQKIIGNGKIESKPNSVKQKNGFPPNFIHSLDATHMMLTSLYCWNAGIAFASVHDCFWTHACDIDIMNKVCREQFVALHRQPILENLSGELQKCVANYCRENEVISRKPDKKLEILESVIKSVPKRGSFSLNNILKSTYFFS